MRQRIFEDAKGNLCGEYPHDPAVGFQRGKRGLRRRLVLADERAQLDDADAMALALKRYAAKEAQIRDQQFANAARDRAEEAKRKAMTMRTAADEWLASIQNIASRKTRLVYSQTMALYVDLVGDHPLREFSRENNLAFMRALSTLHSKRHPDKVISVNTQEMHIRHLGIFLRWAHDVELIDRTFRLKKPRTPVKEMETFSLDQLQTLKAFLAAKVDQARCGCGLPGVKPTARQKRELVNALNLYRAFMLATGCLLRVGAIAHLPLANIDLDAQIVRIRDVPELGWKNKACKWPNKPINDNLLAFLRDDLASRGKRERWFLDDGRGNPWYSDYSHVSKSMAKACREAGMPEGVKPFHWGMRAALITWLLNNGEAPQKVQQLADHASLQTTLKYYNTRAASQRSAVDKLPSF